MNRKVCEKCRRYGGSWNGNGKTWYCAEDVQLWSSEVIPEHSSLEKDKFHPITEGMLKPPEWCERPLEQVILSPDEDVDIKKDATLVYDGNRRAEWKAEEIKALKEKF